MMKKFLLIVLLLVGFVVAGVGIFLATFNADRYRPLLVSKLEEAIHHPVRLERLSLGWRNGVALQLRGLSILEPDGGPSQEPLLAVESFDAVVRLAPLLRRDVQITSIVITRPHIHAGRDVSGRLNLPGLAATTGNPESPHSRTCASSGISPKNGISSRSAIFLAPPLPKMFSVLPQCEQV